MMSQLLDIYALLAKPQLLEMYPSLSAKEERTIRARQQHVLRKSSGRNNASRNISPDIPILVIPGVLYILSLKWIPR